VERWESFARNLLAEENLKRDLANKGLQNISLFAYDTVDSTNTRAKLFASSRVAGISPAIFISRAQSAGRGTRARTFESPEGAGLYMSILLPGSAASKNPQLLTSYTAVAVSRAIFSASGGKIKPRIKWVNDIVLSDRKLGGILTEAAYNDRGERFFIVGIGINLSPAAHSDEVLSLMTTLFECGFKIDAHELLCHIACEFFSSLDTYDSDVITEQYRALSSLIGRRVEISGIDDGCIATAIDIDNNRAIVIRRDDGSIKKYCSGDVSIRPKGE